MPIYPVPTPIEDAAKNLIQNAIGQLNAYILTNTLTYNFYPVVHTPLTVSNGISVTGTFQTTDGSPDGILSYVTVMKQTGNASVTDGLGFAWMKGDGTLINVYLVDNNALSSAIMFNQGYLLNNIGNNPFLAAVSGLININTLYSFQLDIGVYYSLDLWIWPTSKGALNKTDPSTIYVGQGPFTPRSNGTDFGFSVAGTQGYEWYYSNLEIQSISALHTAALYRLKANISDFPDGTETTISFYGYGVDGTNYGLDAFLYEYINGSWVWTEVGSSTATNTTPSNQALLATTFTMGSQFRDVDNFVNFLVTTPTANNGPTGITTDYISMTNTLPSGIHIGGKSDIYIYDPYSVAVGIVTVPNTNGIIDLSASNGFSAPILNIAQIAVHSTGQVLTPIVDWNLNTDNPGLAYSTSEVPYLAIASQYSLLDLDVVYRYYYQGQNIQTMLNSDTYRFVGTDNLGKIMPPVIFTINYLNYRGPLTITQAIILIQQYLFASPATISVLDIINLLSANGATFIDTSSIDISITEYDHTRSIIATTKLTTTYTLPTFRGFYTDSYELAGLIQG